MWETLSQTEWDSQTDCWIWCTTECVQHIRVLSNRRHISAIPGSPFRALCRMTQSVSEIDILETRHRHWEHTVECLFCAHNIFMTCVYEQERELLYLRLFANLLAIWEIVVDGFRYCRRRWSRCDCGLPKRRHCEKCQEDQHFVTGMTVPHVRIWRWTGTWNNSNLPEICRTG